MRPHRLRVTAFGAFGGTVEVDFDALVAAGGLFLLHGETGAGKTTLLDALGFALYGRVPGERGKARRLRSDHAPAGLATEVELDATIGGRRLRVTRRPEQIRPKLRGEGFTTEQARILIAELGGRGEWETVSTRAGEADQEIADLMGMSAEQFFQVVLLPQGQFAQFLHAGAEGRGKLLQRLFGTDRFRSAEEWLAERRRASAHDVAGAWASIGQVAARIAEASGVAEAPAEEPGELGAWAHRLAAAAADALALARSEIDRCRAELEQAVERQQAAVRLGAAQRRRAEAMRQRDELVSASPRVAALRDELDAARRAAEVATALAAARKAGEALAQARADEERARLDVAALSAGGHASGSDVKMCRYSSTFSHQTESHSELREGGQNALRQAGRLEALCSLADQAAAEDAAAASAAGAAAGHLTAARECQAGIAEIQQKHQAALAARDAAREAAAELPGARAEADRLRRAAADAVAVQVASAEADRKRQAHLSAREHTVGLREEAARLREARVDGMRAELAATLVDHAPCPVCGALDHPEPCELRGDLVTREQEEKAVHAAERATRSAEAIGTELAAVQARVDDLRFRLEAAGFEPQAAELAAGLAAKADAAQAEEARLTSAAATLPILQTDLDQLRQQIADGQTRSAELAQQHADELAQAARAERRAAEHRDRLREQLGDATDLATALAAARAAARSLIAAADAAEATARAEQSMAQASEAAGLASASAGFADVGEAGKAYRDAARREASAELIREHEAATAAASALLAAPELDVALDPPADIVAAAELATDSRARHDEAMAVAAREQRKHEQLARLVPDLDRKLAAYVPLAESAAEVRRLADLAAGQGANTLRMTLSSFVLAARLEDVAVAASQRLLRMTAGRYSLVHTDARRGGGRSGLGLLACDSWTGQDRDTSTLSGGETFMASLALALGLADVVTEEAGGGRIEALFVDEGFGSLDEDTLDEVMNVLDGLREGGRLVGVVSHVPELRQRIPAQVQVRKAPTGSHLAVVG